MRKNAYCRIIQSVVEWFICSGSIMKSLDQGVKTLNERRRSMAQERRMNLRFDPDKFDQLDEKRFRERTSFQEIGARLFDEWLTGKHPEPKLPPQKPADPLVQKMDVIRASGKTELFAMIKKSVEVVYGILQHSVSQEEIEKYKAAADNSPTMAGGYRGPRNTGEGLLGAGQARTRKSA
jgi:hypothetical protein